MRYGITYFSFDLVTSFADTTSISVSMSTSHEEIKKLVLTGGLIKTAKSTTKNHRG